jgi:hypothetical protein
VSLAEFEKEVAVARDVAGNDRVWFPKWIRRYELSLRRASKSNRLPVTRDGALRFSRMLLERNAPAWQRLQAIAGSGGVSQAWSSSPTNLPSMISSTVPGTLYNHDGAIQS